MFELTMDGCQDKGEIVFVASDEVGEVSRLLAVFHGDDVVLHNDVLRWSPGIAKALLEMFAVVRGVLREMGVNLIIPVSGDYTEKIGKWWRMMGFECFGEVEGGGKTVHFAVMEA